MKDTFNKAKQLLEEGFITWDRETVEKSKDLFENVYNSHKNHPVAHYYYLFSSYKLALFKLKDKRTVNAWCKEVVKETKNAEHPQDDKMASEFLALQATAYDALCMHSMFKSMYYAKKAKDVFAQSLEKHETNPRAFLFRGIYFFHRNSSIPDAYKRALRDFVHAEELFDEEEVHHPEKKEITIDWGRAENLLWIGKAYKQKNEPGKAENYFSTALDRYPGYRWAKHELNELEKVASV